MENNLQDKIKKGNTELQEIYKSAQIELDKLKAVEITTYLKQKELILFMKNCKLRAIEQGYDERIFNPINF